MEDSIQNEIEDKLRKRKEKEGKESILLTRRIVFLLLTILWMTIVFAFSSEVGDTSSSTSGNTIRKVIEIVTNNLDEATMNYYVELFQPLARKLAHFILYTLGGILIYNIKLPRETKRRIAFSIGLAMIYSISDEVHQAFVPGRTGRIFDVFVDTMGASFGVIIMLILKKLLNIKKK